MNESHDRHGGDATLRPLDAAVTLQLADPEWQAFVDRRPDALPFHLPGWVATVAGAYGLRAFVIVVRDPSGAIAAGVPVVETRPPLRRKRWVSLPFTDLCPPLAATPGDALRLVDALDAARAASGASRWEARGPLPAGVPFEDAGYRHVLRLGPDASAVFAGFHRSQVQRNIRKAEANDLVLRVGTTQDDLLDDFYRLHLDTRRRLGVPIQPRRFFTLLRERVLRSGIGWIVTVESEGRAIASALFLAANETVVYKYGASDADAWRLRPNHLLFWHAIRTACESGYAAFDFGRSDADADGLRAFKASWGADEERLIYHAIGDATAMPASAPGPGLATRSLATVIRRSPPWVCRWTGELLYRFVA